MNINTEIINKNGYDFKLKKSIFKYDNKIISQNITLGGEYDDCISISYIYTIDGKISYAKIPHLLYEPECALNKKLEKGIGTELMIKTCLKYAYKTVNSISIFEFEDMSHIDCIEKNIKNSKPPRNNIKPVNLAYFFIAYHGETWYENKFNAKMKDPIKYKKYRESLDFLTDEKSKVDFREFLIISCINNYDIMEYLKNKYEKSKTYREFFNLIPKKERCEILYTWLNNFMDYYLKNVFSVKEWIIDINDINNINNQKGGNKKNIGKNYYIFDYKYYKLIKMF